MTVLVTGACGLIGREFLAHPTVLLKNDQYIGVDKAPVNDATRPHEVLDLTDGNAVWHFFQRFPDIKTVVHLAGITEVGADSDANLTILQNILFAWSSGDMSQKHLILAGTAAEYGDIPLTAPPATETSELNPTEPYAMSKAQCANYLSTFSSRTKLISTVLRFANVYGRWDRPNRIIPRVIRSILKQEPVTLHANGSPARQFVYVEDVARAVWKVVIGKHSGIFNIGPLYERSLLDVASTIGLVVHDLQLKENRHPTPLILRLQNEGGGAKRVAIDSTKARKTLGWEPYIPLYLGLTKTVRHIMEEFYAYDQDAAPAGSD